MNKIKSKKNNWYQYNHIKQIAISGLMVGVAVIVGFFGYFPLAGGNVYLLAAVIFLFPLVLKLPYAILSTISAVIMVDSLTGYIAFTWISIIAYVGAILIIWTMGLLKIKIIFLLSTLVASAYLIFIFLSLEWIIFGKSYALKDAIATTIQMSIVLPIVYIFYIPIKKSVKFVI
ncbi:hypothetical protein [Mycoplasma marinum]|uniref:ECF transporter S component n=1 Tax=Mycoplasma marinum TaxID=1937190 RepID=A0A4R0XVG2_9MOLU|nr:hypothetical protein [Mycoplasma marinum]TCG11732.1 hypothetical protein C4B24_01105 [Mycoplasma marinum]